MDNKSLFFALAVFLLLAPNIAYAGEVCNDVYLFYSKTCPYCAKEKVFLEALEKKYPALDVQYIEVSENYELFRQMSEQFNSIPVGVPRTLINGTVFIGFTEEEGEMEYVSGYKAYNGYKSLIESSIVNHLAAQKLINISGNESCPDHPPVEKDDSIIIFPLVMLGLFILFYIMFRKKVEKRYMIGILLAVIIVILFYLSQRLPLTSIISFAKQFSFPVFTFIIALLDGFNPCAFTVLAILLSLLIYSNSRKKMALIGAIFIITSAVMYFLFIIVLLTLRTELVGAHKDIIRAAVGLIALVAGSINIKDFFFFKKGISLTIPKKHMGRLMSKMRNIVNEVKEAQTPRALFLAIIGTAILAVLVNLVELGCTLILPIQYIEVLITNYGSQVSPLHYFYIAFYCIVYVIPLFVILGSFLYTFESNKMTETRGRVLKLIGGLVMIGLGLILLLKPELMLFG